MTQSINAAERIEIERACERLVHAYSRALDLGNMSAAADSRRAPDAAEKPC